MSGRTDEGDALDPFDRREIKYGSSLSVRAGSTQYNIDGTAARSGVAAIHIVRSSSDQANDVAAAPATGC